MAVIVNFAFFITRSGPVDTMVDLPAKNPVSQRATLEALQLEAGALDALFPSKDQAQENTFVKLFALAQTHSVEIRSVNSADPVIETLGRDSFQKLDSRVTVQGIRTNVINMLLELPEVFGETLIVDNVSVSGTLAAWRVEFNLTQYVQDS